MTNTTVPTDAELLELADVCEIRDVLRNGLVREAELLEFIRAVLAHWGPHANAAAEPFGYFRAEPFGWTDCAETDEGAIALYEKPQAPEVPLSDEQADVIALVEFERHCGRPHPWEGAQPWVIAAIKAAHGITAKEFTP